MRRIICRTVSTAESTTESRSAISHTFYNVVEKRNPYESKNRRSEPTLASLLCPVYSILYLSRTVKVVCC
jgi:hypothetical protein